MMHYVKYLLEGLAVSLVTYVVVGNRMQPEEIVFLGVVAMVVFLVLDLAAPSVFVTMDYDYPFQQGGEAAYKLEDGAYSAKVLSAGFNEEAEAANNADYDNSTAYPWKNVNVGLGAHTCD